MSHHPVRTVLSALILTALLPPLSAHAQGSLTSGGNHAGSISTPGEIDAWTFEAGLGDAILLSVGEVLTSEIDPDFRPWIRLRRPDGVEIGSDIGALAATIYTTAPLTGTYTVLMRDSTVNRPGTTLGDYLLHFILIPGSLTVPGGDQGGALTNGGNHTGAIHRADLDPWTFTAAQNDAILVSVGEVITSEIDPDFMPWIRIYGPTGALIASDLGTLAATLNVTAPLSGTYTVVVADSNVNREGSAMGDYVLHLLKIPGTLAIPAGDHGGAMINGGNHPGRIGAAGAQPALQRADLDPWTFTAAQNDTILVTIGEVLDSEIDPDFMPWIRLYGPNGTLLGSDLGTLAATLSVAAPLSGTYTVVVADSNVNREGSAVGDYVLHLVKIPGTFTVPPADQGGAMANGVMHAGRIGAPGINPALQRADLDPWTFAAAQNTAVTVNVAEVLPGGPDPGFNPLVRLYGPTGALVASSTGALNASVNINAPLAGLYTAVVADSNINRQGSAVGDYTIVVHGAIDPGLVPTSVDDSYQTARNTSLVIAAPGVLGNDIANAGGAMSAALVTGPASGTLSLLGNGAFTYTPAVGFVGVATFTYRAVNSVGAGNVATVTVTVTPDTPTTVADAYAAVTGTVLTVGAPGVLANDNSNDGGTLTAQLVSAPASGALSLNPDGSFTYTPNAGFVGGDSFSYRALSTIGPGNIAAVTITVHPEGPLPPTNLYVASIAGNTVTIRWTPPATGPVATNFELEGALTAGGPALAIIPMGVAPAFTFQAPNGSFLLRVHTIAGASRSAASNEVPLHVNVPVPPSAPANLLAMVNGSTLALAWRNTFGGGAATSLMLDVSGAVNASIPLGLTETFTFAGVPPGTYTLSLRALNDAGASASSNSVTLTFPLPCTGAPDTPANFLAYRVGNTINVLWDPAASGQAPTGYALNVTGSFVASIPTPVGRLSGGVGPGTYNLSVVAVNVCGSSAPTAVQTMIVP